MKHNDSGHPPLDIFDSTIADTATQTITAETNPIESPFTTFLELALEANEFTTTNTLTYQTIRLTLHDASTPENDYFDTETIASAGFTYNKHDPVALVGGVTVREQFQNHGIGTRLKHQLNNHIDQQNTDRTFTWLDSNAGKRLADRTGYHPTTDYFPDHPDIWIRND